MKNLLVSSISPDLRSIDNIITSRLAKRLPLVSVLPTACAVDGTDGMLRGTPLLKGTSAMHHI